MFAKIGLDTAENEPIEKSDPRAASMDHQVRIDRRAAAQRDGAPIVARKEWIEILKFWIQFFTNFGNFTDFSSKFCKISGIFNEFRHFGTCS